MPQGKLLKPVFTGVAIAIGVTVLFAGGALYYFKTGDLPIVNWWQFRGKYLISPPANYTECINAILAGRVVEWEWSPPVPCEFHGRTFYPDQTTGQENADTPGSKRYRNTRYGFELQYPNGATLSIYDLARGGDESVVPELPPDAAHITIKQGYAHVSVCRDCGPGGVGIDGMRREESITLDGKTYQATGFYQNDRESTSKTMVIDLPNISIRYGYQSEYGSQLTPDQMKAADASNNEILSTFKFTKQF